MLGSLSNLKAGGASTHGQRTSCPAIRHQATDQQGLEQGYLTYAEVNDHLPDDLVDPEQIEDIISMINGMGIDVHEVAPDAETLLLNDGNTGNREVDDTAAEEAAAALTALDTEGGRTTDPVRMYMREMGTVELLTREGEIAIAKRIEEGLSQVQAALGTFPLSTELLLSDYEAHKEGKKRLAEIVVGFNDLIEEADAAAAALAAAGPVAVDEDAVDEDADEDGDDDAAEEEAGPTGPDPVEVATRMENLANEYAKFKEGLRQVRRRAQECGQGARRHGRHFHHAQAAAAADRFAGHPAA